MEVIWIILIVVICGAAGGFANVFIGDSGLHPPKLENGIFMPGFLGTVIVGALAALASWASTKTYILIGNSPTPLAFTTGDIANALLIGFGGAKWFKSETESDVWQKTASIAASKQASPETAVKIANSTPAQALDTVMNMH